MKLTIVIPAYNSYRWLEKLIPHISQQLEKDAELLIIDDGSTDELKNRTSIDTYHHNKNLGVSAARNTGVELAKGEYIAFVDADDWVSDDFVRTILNTITKDKSRHDIYWFKVKTEDRFENYHIVPVWGKVYHKDIFKECLFDEELKAGEDIMFYEETKNAGHTCKTIDKAIYHYRWSKNPDSLSKKYNRGDIW